MTYGHIKGAFNIFYEDGQRVQLKAPHLHVQAATKYTPPPRRLGTITQTYHRYQFTDPERMDSLVSQGTMFAHNLCPIERKDKRRKWTRIVRPKTNREKKRKHQPNTIEPTAPYANGREIILWTCLEIGESKLRPFARATSDVITGPQVSRAYIYIY